VRCHVRTHYHLTAVNRGVVLRKIDINPQIGHSRYQIAEISSRANRVSKAQRPWLSARNTVSLRAKHTGINIRNTRIHQVEQNIINIISRCCHHVPVTEEVTLYVAHNKIEVYRHLSGSVFKSQLPCFEQMLPISQCHACVVGGHSVGGAVAREEFVRDINIKLVALGVEPVITLTGTVINLINNPVINKTRISKGVSRKIVLGGNDNFQICITLVRPENKRGLPVAVGYSENGHQRLFVRNRS
jgi:hypothetical protein